MKSFFQNKSIVMIFTFLNSTTKKLLSFIFLIFDQNLVQNEYFYRIGGSTIS
jgi:hypothetical protein